MMRPQIADSQLSELLRAVDSWRRLADKPRAAMPAELWSAAAKLAVGMGSTSVAAALKIDCGKLRKLVRQLEQSVEPTGLALQPKIRPSPIKFVEVPAATVAKSLSHSLSCMLEAEAPGGGQLRARLDNVTALDVATIIREFSR